MKLKTLEDFNVPWLAKNSEILSSELDIAQMDYLRQGIIKWIKALISFEEAWKNGKKVRFNKKHPEWNRIYNLFGSCECVGDINTILMEIFNIEDEDLK